MVMATQDHDHLGAARKLEEFIAEYYSREMGEDSELSDDHVRLQAFLGDGGGTPEENAAAYTEAVRIIREYGGEEYGRDLPMSLPLAKGNFRVPEMPTSWGDSSSNEVQCGHCKGWSDSPHDEMDYHWCPECGKSSHFGGFTDDWDEDEDYNPDLPAGPSPVYDFSGVGVDPTVRVQNPTYPYQEVQDRLRSAAERMSFPAPDPTRSRDHSRTSYPGQYAPQPKASRPGPGYSRRGRGGHDFPRGKR